MLTSTRNLPGLSTAATMTLHHQTTMIPTMTTTKDMTTLLPRMIIINLPKTTSTVLHPVTTPLLTKMITMLLLPSLLMNLNLTILPNLWDQSSWRRDHTRSSLSSLCRSQCQSPTPALTAETSILVDTMLTPRLDVR